jgi:hypothetical protein
VTAKFSGRISERAKLFLGGQSRIGDSGLPLQCRIDSATLLEIALLYHPHTGKGMDGQTLTGKEWLS